MSFFDDREIRRQCISDHYANPHHYTKSFAPHQQPIALYSPTCNDHFEIAVKWENDTLVEFAFSGVGCSISTASLSIMGDLVLNQSRKRVQTLATAFLAMVYQKPYDEAILEEAAAFKEVHRRANRIKCATLGWMGLLGTFPEENQ